VRKAPTQLDDIAKHGIEIPSDEPEEPLQHVNIIFIGGGDLKYQSCQAGLYGHGGTFFCTRCTPSQDCGQPKEQSNHNHRSFTRCCMLAHKFGAEWALLEAYTCPGCNKRIEDNDQFAPEAATAMKHYPKQHFGHYHGCGPVMPIELWDFIPDLLHGMLRSVINMFFITVTMNLSSEVQARNLSDYMRETFQIAAEPYFNMDSRPSTRKNLQIWANEQCWVVMQNIDQILERVFAGVPQDVAAKYSLVWSAWFDLYAVLLIDNIQRDKWPQLATIVDTKQGSHLT